MGTVVRPYRHPDDLSELRRVFLLATNTGPGSPVFVINAHIAPYVTAARCAVVATLLSFGIPFFKSSSHPQLESFNFQLLATFFATASGGLLLYIWDFRRRTNELFDTFRSDALKDDFRDIISRWNLIVKDGGARCVPNGPNGFWVAELGGDIVGCVGLKEDSQRPGVGYVGRLAISPDHQGKGIGKKLMAVVEEHARLNGIKRMELVTSPFNKAAQRFYASLGWGQCGTIKYGGMWIPKLGKNVEEGL